MLAYVFWHWRRGDVDDATYGSRLAEFHEALRRSAPEGFVSSCAFRAGAAPWLDAAETYEDWYLTHGSYALDRLEESAVSGDCRLPHEAAARSALGGTAGLYRLRMGGDAVREATWSAWLAKPQGMTYEQFYARLEPVLAGSGAGLWGRQMTLGPTPEFCLAAPSKLLLPSGLEGFERSLERLWPTQVLGLPQESMNLS